LTDNLYRRHKIRGLLFPSV